ncbi:hypothetical protein N431DRAFT_434848 [Stipitochalara longipes BDJ]|nr:hypothetical protein N431DRAFT_434848 [Stipitochalara longipes BDJ]
MLLRDDRLGLLLSGSLVGGFSLSSRSAKRRENGVNPCIAMYASPSIVEISFWGSATHVRNIGYLRSTVRKRRVTATSTSATMTSSA